MATWFEGTFVLADREEEGHVAVEAGRVVASGFGPAPQRPTARGWIVPAPVNAHTHVADACLRGMPGKPATVPELVGPGGWKQRELAKAPASRIEEGIRSYVGEMAAVGTAAFLDFREGGLAGVRTLRSLAQTDALPVRPIVLGRPAKLAYDEAEVEQLLQEADGIGLSAMRDFPRPGDVEAIAEACHGAGKPFALHASEARRESMEDVLSLEPSFLVHCTQATKPDLEAVAHAKVPVVVCPRSNAWYGMRTPIERMLEAGVTVAVGTDNGMTCDGDLWKELAQLHAWVPHLTVPGLLRLATWNARPLAGLRTRMPRPGDAADLVVLPKVPWTPVDAGKPGFRPMPLQHEAPGLSPAPPTGGDA